MKLSTRLITGALLLSQLTLGLGAFVPPAAAQAPQVQAQELAPPSNKQKLHRLAVADVMLQKASQLQASLTPDQRQSVKEILERYAPQLKELSEQFKAPTPSASGRSTQAPQLRKAPDLAQAEEVTVRLRAIQVQIEAELPSVLSQQQLQQYREATKPLETDNAGSATTQSTIASTSSCTIWGQYGTTYAYYTYMNGWWAYLYEEMGNTAAREVYESAARSYSAGNQAYYHGVDYLHYEWEAYTYAQIAWSTAQWAYDSLEDHTTYSYAAYYNSVYARLFLEDAYDGDC